MGAAHPTAVKFCGIRRGEDIAFVNETRPDFIGFVFAQSRRQVTAGQAASLSRELDAGIQTVGVFVNEPADSLCETVRTARLDVVQLHGDETAETIHTLRERLPQTAIWKAVRVRDAAGLAQADALPVDALLLDSFVPGSYGGSGQTANWALIAQTTLQTPFFLAGGLCAENLPEALAAVHPVGIDLSGGIETQGCKDLAKMRAVMQVIRTWISQ